VSQLCVNTLPATKVTLITDGIFTTPLFHKLAATCLGSSLAPSGSFLDPSQLLELQMKWVVYYIMCGYVACVPECRGSVV
jgi:hypothetical protein